MREKRFALIAIMTALVSVQAVGKLSLKKMVDSSPISIESEKSESESKTEESKPTEVADKSADTKESQGSAALGESREDIAFNENKENLLNCGTFLKKFVEANNAKAATMFADAPVVINLAKETYANLEAAIPKPFSSYQKKNSEAQKIYFGTKMSHLKTNITKAEDRLEGIKTSMLKRIERDVEWMGTPEARLKVVVKTMANINESFAVLEKHWKDDSAVADAKSRLIPQAEKSYEKLQKQVAGNRMPATAYQGADRAKLEGDLSAAYKAVYSSNAVLKVVITDSKWVDKTEYNLTNQTWEDVSYLNAHVAVEKDPCTVYVMSFKKNSDKVIKVHGSSTNYPVLRKNIK